MNSGNGEIVLSYVGHGIKLLEYIINQNNQHDG